MLEHLSRPDGYRVHHRQQEHRPPCPRVGRVRQDWSPVQVLEAGGPEVQHDLSEGLQVLLLLRVVYHGGNQGARHLQWRLR